jgi:hypothetical protein
MTISLQFDHFSVSPMECKPSSIENVFLRRVFRRDARGQRLIEPGMRVAHLTMKLPLK